MKARVFLSCGQKKGTDEPDVAETIAREVESLGFEKCYVATTEQSLQGLRENIFRELHAADYFIFVDFKRDELKSDDAGSVKWRGSLFSHQELAIASFLEMPEPVIFQEKDVEGRNGMLSAFQGNATPFSDRRLLPAIVKDEVRKRLESGKWILDSRNTLSLRLASPQYRDAPFGETYLRHFHIEVHNNHARKAARNCCAYLERVDHLETGKTLPLETIEFKWAGTPLPYVRIGPEGFRRFDGCFFDAQDPSRIQFSVITDSPHYLPPVRQPGSYRLTFAVVSENFPTAKGSFRLTFADSLERVQLTAD